MLTCGDLLFGEAKKVKIIRLDGTIAYVIKTEPNFSMNKKLIVTENNDI